MAWLAVDKDGTENIFPNIPFRRKDWRGVLFGNVIARYTKNQRNKWSCYWSTDEQDVFPRGSIELPKGSIKKLIGKELTWKDEPVEI